METQGMASPVAPGECVPIGARPSVTHQAEADAFERALSRAGGDEEIPESRPGDDGVAGDDAAESNAGPAAALSDTRTDPAPESQTPAEGLSSSGVMSRAGGASVGTAVSATLSDQRSAAPSAPGSASLSTGESSALSAFRDRLEAAPLGGTMYFEAIDAAFLNGFTVSGNPARGWSLRVNVDRDWRGVQAVHEERLRGELAESAAPLLDLAFVDTDTGV